jgi:hypothetical protein
MQSKKGVSTLIAGLAAVIVGSMGIYYFKSLASLSAPEKDRITHMNNAMVMAQAITERVKGVNVDKDYFVPTDASGNIVYNDQPASKTVASFLPTEISKTLDAGVFTATLSEMLHNDIISIPAHDPSSERFSKGEKSLTANTVYDRTKTKLTFQFKGGTDGNASAALTTHNETDGVEGLIIKVNLVGSTYNVAVADTELSDLTGNAVPVDGDASFFYLCMISCTDVGTGYTATSWIDTGTHTDGILSSLQPSITQIDSIKVPDDYLPR